MTTQTNQAPYHQIDGPADIWIAEADSDEPDLSVEPPSKLNFPAIPSWATGTDYNVGQLVKIGASTTTAYRCIQGHTAATANKPDTGSSKATYWTELTAGAWEVLGNNSFTDTGIEITRGQEMSGFRPFRNLGRSKSFRISESWTAKVEIADFTADTYAQVLGLSVTTVAAASGKAGAKRVPLMRGRNVKRYALLIRLLTSPYGPGNFKSQIWVPRCEIDPLDDPNLVEGEVAMLGVTFDALQHPDHGFGYKTDQIANAA